MVTVKSVRAATLVLGSVAAGAWVARPVTPWVTRMMKPGVIREGAEAHRAMVLMPLLASVPHFVAAVVAGMVLGYVAEGGRSRLWVLGLLTVFVAWMYGASVLAASSLGGAAWLGSGLQALASCLVAVVGFWFGLRVRRSGPVA